MKATTYAERKIWITSNGEKIHVTSMDDDHLNNAYKYLRNHKLVAMGEKLRLKWIQIFFEEKVRRQYDESRLIYEIY